MVYKIIV